MTWGDVGEGLKLTLRDPNPRPQLPRGNKNIHLFGSREGFYTDQTNICFTTIKAEGKLCKLIIYSVKIG